MYNVFVYKQKTAYELRISGWGSDVCSSDRNWRDVARFRNDAPTNGCFPYEIGSGKPVEQHRLYAPARQILDNDALPGRALLIVCRALLQAWPLALVLARASPPLRSLRTELSLSREVGLTLPSLVETPTRPQQ